MSRPVWLLFAPVLFLILWSGGYVVAKVGLLHAAPMAILAIRYACVIVIMTVLFAIFRPPLPTKRIDWLHLAIVGVLVVSRMWWKFSGGALRALGFGPDQATRSRVIGSMG